MLLEQKSICADVSMCYEENIHAEMFIRVRGEEKKFVMTFIPDLINEGVRVREKVYF